MNTTTMQQSKTRDIVFIGIFAALIAICSWISIPTTVPFTLQTMGVFTAVGLLGGKRGSLAVLVYILLGLVGLPVFAGFSGGVGVLFGTTGGYIIGFLASALLMWGIETVCGRGKIVLAPWYLVWQSATPSGRSGLWRFTQKPPAQLAWVPFWDGASFPSLSPI